MALTASTQWPLKHGSSEFNVDDAVVAMQAMLGPEHVSVLEADRLAYARDRWPWLTQNLRFSRFPKTQPDIVLWPGGTEDVARILQWADENRVPVIPFGAGSGVCGGTVPVKGGLMLDMKRMQHVDINPVAGTVTCQPGILGVDLERILNEAGWTLGHFPQSMTCSTVGGWVATRSAGQASTLYGKIEDMVIALEVVLPGGKVVRTRQRPRAATGPDLMQLFVGSEGTLGVITEITLRLARKPEVQKPLVLSFPGWRDGLRAIRQAMQSGLRPAVVRLYDEAEATHFTGEDGTDPRATLILIFDGLRGLAEAESELFEELSREHGGRREGDAPAHKWMKERFVAKSPPRVQAGSLLDTLEVAAPWDRIEDTYTTMKNAVAKVAPDVKVSAHWSHVYADGACMYATFVMDAPDFRTVDHVYQHVWNAAVEGCLEAGATISHHHGVGMLKAPWMRKDLGTAFDVLVGVKNQLDPNNIMNPGKMGFEP